MPVINPMLAMGIGHGLSLSALIGLNRFAALNRSSATRRCVTQKRFAPP
jgi:hypothetical protein